MQDSATVKSTPTRSGRVLRADAVTDLRTAFEHALYASLLVNESLEEEVLERLDIQSFRAWKDLTDAFEVKIGNETFDLATFISQIEPNRRPEDSWIASVIQVCNRFEDAASLYHIYRLLSSYVHPNFQSAHPYFSAGVVKRDTPFKPGPDFSPGSFLITALSIDMWAISALNGVLGTEHLKDLLKDMAVMLGTREKLTLK